MCLHQKKQHFPHLAVTLLVATLVGLLVACRGEINLTGPDLSRSLCVEVQNASALPVTIADKPSPGSISIAPGTDGGIGCYYQGLHPLPTVHTFAIQRDAATLARVSFRALRYPADRDGTRQTATLVLTEPEPGAFLVTSSHPDYVVVLSVTPST